MRAQLLVPACSALGESPVWHPEEHALYWVDIEGGRLHRWDQRCQTHVESGAPGAPVGALLIDQSGALLVFGAGLVPMRVRLPIVEAVGRVRALKGLRANDAIADPLGRVLAGAMRREEREHRLSRGRRLLRRLAGGLYPSAPSSPPTGLHRLEADRWQRVASTEISNGLAFTADDRMLYHVDSAERALHRYVYDGSLGAFDVKQQVRVFGREEGVPDGIAADQHDHLWCALWGGGAVVRLDPDGRETARIELPCRRVTSVAFGDDDRKTLFITTAIDPAVEEPNAGGLFFARVEVPGLSPHRARLPTLFEPAHV